MAANPCPIDGACAASKIVLKPSATKHLGLNLRAITEAGRLAVARQFRCLSSLMFGL
jgi:hypothetical protein